MDRILMQGMVFHGYHGVYEEEKRKGQRFVVDAILSLDLKKAGLSDDVTDTIHYGEAFERIRAIMEGAPYDLIERVAEQIASDLLRAYPQLEQVKITVYKPDAPVDGVFDRFGVEICRKSASI